MADESLEIDLKINASESAQSVKELKQSIKDLQDAAIAAGDSGDDALAQKYVNAAGAARDKMGDLNEAINAVRGTSDKLAAIGNIGQSIAGGFAAAQGAAALFGASQEDVQKQLLKVQAATSLLSGIQSLSNIQEQAGLVKNIALREIQTLNIKLNTAAEEGGVFVRAAATVAQKALNLAMNNFPALIIIGAIVAMVAAFKNLGDTAEQTALKQVNANKMAMESMAERRQHDVDVLKALGKDTEEVEIENTRNRIARLRDEAARISADENLDDDVRKERLAEINKQWSESIDALDILKAQALTKEKEDNEKSAEDLKKVNEDKQKSDQDSLKKRAEYHQQYLDALAKHNEDIRALALEHIAELEQYEQDKLAQAQSDADAGLAIEEDAVNRGFAKFVEDKKNRIALEQQSTDAQLQIADYAAKSLSSLGNAVIKDANKLASFQKEIALIQIGIDTARAISSVVAAAASTSITPIDLALKVAAGIAVVFSNIAQARKLLSNPKATPTTLGGGGGEAVTKPKVDLAVPQSTAPRAGSTPRATGGTPQRNNSPVLPTKENCNCPPSVGSGSTSFDENGNMVIKAFVVESDITKNQARIKSIKERSTF